MLLLHIMFPWVFECVFIISNNISETFMLKVPFCNMNVILTLLFLRAPTGLHDHIWHISLHNAVLRVKIDHGEWTPLDRNTAG